MMKNIKLILKTVLFVLGLSVNAQIASNNSINATINSESAFLDVSSSASTTNFAKGLGFPQTNLTTFSFVSVAGSFIKFKTGYDGLLVYNIATGTTPATGAGVGGQAVTPGFYYFSNPTPTPLRSSASGEWIALSGVTDTPTFEPATEMDVNLSDPLVTPVISTETATSVFTFVNTRDRESGDKTTQIMNLPPPTPVGKLIIINNSANSLNVQFNPSVGGNNVVAAYRGVMLIATADGWLNLSE